MSFQFLHLMLKSSENLIGHQNADSTRKKNQMSITLIHLLLKAVTITPTFHSNLNILKESYFIEYFDRTQICVHENGINLHST